MKKISILIFTLSTLTAFAGPRAIIKVTDPAYNQGEIALNEKGIAVDLKNPRNQPTIFDFSARHPYYIKSCYTGAYSEMKKLIDALVKNAKGHPALIRVQVDEMKLEKTKDISIELSSRGVDMDFEDQLLIRNCK